MLDGRVTKFVLTEYLGAFAMLYIQKGRDVMCIVYRQWANNKTSYEKERNKNNNTRIGRGTTNPKCVYIVFYRTVCPLGRRILGYRRECIYTSAI